MQTLLVTGGAGFIGSAFVRRTIAGMPEVRVVNLDALTYAGNLDSLATTLGTYSSRATSPISSSSAGCFETSRCRPL